MKILAFLFLFTSLQAMASYPELFGSSFSTSSIGNQANLDINDPSNNYYAPSVLGFSDKFNVLLQATSTAVHFKTISGITVTNSTNSTNPTTSGNAKIDYPKFYGMALHAAVPVGGAQHLGTLAFSVFLPIGDLVRSNSGDAFLPEYVMFQSRHQRTSAFVNFAKKWDENFAYSLGAILGFQATADIKTNMSLNGASYGSWASGQSKISPSIGVVASATKRFENMSVFLTYQQEMKSNLKAIVHGEITNPSLALFDATMASMIFYDPHTLRLGTQFSSGHFEYFAGVEYQMWTNYKAPSMSVIKNGGVIVPSTNYEKIVTKDAINPRLGLKYNITNRWSTLLGAQYRMTPLDGDFSGSGNSIDSDTVVGTGGVQYRMVIWSKDVHLGASLQYHHLMDKRVTKSANQENGAVGLKIGAPGYDIGGNIIAGGFGVKFNF